MIDIENRGTQPEFCDRIDADKTIAVRTTFLLWISFLACNCIRLLIADSANSCAYTLWMIFTTKHVICFFNQALTSSSLGLVSANFLKSGQCWGSLSHCSYRQFSRIAELKPVYFNPPSSRMNKRFLWIVLETECAAWMTTGQTHQQTHGCHWTSISSYSTFIFLLIRTFSGSGKEQIFLVQHFA